MKTPAIAVSLILVLAILAGLFLANNMRQHSEDKFTVGAVLPLSGEAAQWGIPPRNAAQLAVDEINASGGINGIQLELVVQDTMCDPKTAVSAFQQLLASNSAIRSVIGAVCSSATLAIAPIAERRKVVLISPASTNPAISDAGNFIFRTIPNDSLRGKTFAEYVYQKAQVTRVAILYINNDAGLGNKEYFAARFKALGGDVLGEEAYAQGTQNVRTQLATLAALNPQALMVVSYLEDAIVVVKQARELIPDMPMYFQAEAIQDPSVRSALGDALEGITYILPARPEGDASVTFSEQYTSHFGTEPDLFAAEAYDAVKLIAQALKQSGSEISSAELRDLLYTVKDYKGASGNITFNSNGDVQKPMAVKRIENGQLVEVFRSAS